MYFPSGRISQTYSNLLVANNTHPKKFEATGSGTAPCPIARPGSEMSSKSTMRNRRVLTQMLSEFFLPFKISMKSELVRLARKIYVKP